MKILHTADWHLGKRLDRFSRLEEQKEVLEEIIHLADESEVDLVLIAGDLFDNFNPNVEAIELFYKSLKRLSLDGKRPVIAIAGNHDSPNFIDAPDPLARACGIILIGSPHATVQKFELDGFKITQSEPGFLELQLQDSHVPIRILHTPYANEVRLKQYLGENKETSLNSVLSEHWKENSSRFCDANGINILLTHLYMSARNGETLEEPDGEKPLKIGNADLVYTDAIPEEIQYVALGHLHAYHNLGTKDKPIIYSSSPLCYSFSEAGQEKYCIMIDAAPGKPVQFEKKALFAGRKLYRKTFSEMDEALHWLENHPHALIELTMQSDTFLKAEDQKRIFQSNEGIVHLIPQIKSENQNSEEIKEINLNQDLQTLFKEYFKTKNQGQDPNEDLMELLKEILA